MLDILIARPTSEPPGAGPRQGVLVPQGQCLELSLHRGPGKRADSVICLWKAWQSLSWRPSIASALLSTLWLSTGTDIPTHLQCSAWGCRVSSCYVMVWLNI